MCHAAAQAAADAAMMRDTLSAALNEIAFSAEQLAERLARLHFAAAASLDAVKAGGGALLAAMLEAWPTSWSAVEADAPTGGAFVACLQSHAWPPTEDTRIF
jgi:hypothetical protein